MISRFTLVGTVLQIAEEKVSTSGIPTIMMTMDVGGETFPVLMQGKVNDLIKNDKIKLGDYLYIEGRMKKDRTFQAINAKMFVLLYATFISMLRTGKG